MENIFLRSQGSSTRDQVSFVTQGHGSSSREQGSSATQGDQGSVASQHQGPRQAAGDSEELSYKVPDLENPKSKY